MNEKIEYPTEESSTETLKNVADRRAKNGENNDKEGKERKTMKKTTRRMSTRKTRKDHGNNDK